MISRSGLLISLVLGTAGQTCIGQEPEISGNWSFRAWTGDGCDFRGVATLGKGADAASYSCELTAKQSCGVDLSWTVRQTCTAIRQGDRVIVRSEIAEFLDASTTEGYLPDNFVLTIETGRRMFGALHSYGVYKTEWIRDEGAVS